MHINYECRPFIILGHRHTTLPRSWGRSSGVWFYIQDWSLLDLIPDSQAFASFSSIFVGSKSFSDHKEENHTSYLQTRREMNGVGRK
jgi:hypothetical protein